MPVDPLTPATSGSTPKKGRLLIGVLLSLVIFAGGFLTGSAIAKKRDEQKLKDIQAFAQQNIADLKAQLDAIQLVKIRIYLIKEGTVIPAERQVLEEKGITAERLSVDELLSGPTDEEKLLGVSTNIPASTSLINFTRDGNLVTLTFSRELNNAKASARKLAREQIEKTMLEFSGITRAIIKIEGVKDEDVLSV